MADTERPRTRAKAWVAELDAARRRAGLTLPEGLTERAAWLGRLLSDWAIAEVAPGRLLPWLPVAYGFGIVVYFTADRESAAWAALALALGGIIAAFMARRRAFGFAVALGFAATAAGFATAALQTARIALSVLAFPVTASVTGFVETREERARSDRVAVRVQHIEARRLDPAPERVRVAVRKGTAPAVGSFVSFKAHLTPPLAPLRPGGYDFARDLYFQRIGASGYVLGSIKVLPAPQAPGLWLRYAALLDGIREAINQRIHTLLPGDRGSIATALITGKRNAISEPVNDAFYVSSLAHVLAISGYHVAVVAGIAFFFIRAGLALFPSLASRRPIKKWAALGALGTGAFYLVLSGASVSTQRAFIMIAIVLIGVLIDRPALTFRTIAIAAFAVLLFTPEAIVHPSFQMSFAAALALIAAYQFGLPWRASADTPRATRLALWGGREIFGLIMASLVAGLATAFFGVSLPSPGAVWRARQSTGHAGHFRLGDADGHSWGADHAARRRCGVLAADGGRRRLDDRRGVVGGAFAGRGRPYPCLRHRALAAGDRRAVTAVLAAFAIALERGGARARRKPMGAGAAAPRPAGRR
jgi:competence protein ComEC